MRWIWIDRILEFKPKQSARAVKCLSLAEDFFADHFPGWPVMPGALMLEGLAQTGGILVGEANDFKEKVILAKIPKAVFHREVLAGDEIVYDVELLHLRKEGATVAGKVLVGAALAVEAEIFFAHLDQSRSQQFFGDHNFVFTGELQRILGLVREAGKRPEQS
ncbi:MAG: beta-hydroxyacyl-ACP dehydratase [Planctomycetia bacterium]|nr:beta-hydroxyacyl-ACP dehydratase [Planctomycetia bacterium]